MMNSAIDLVKRTKFIDLVLFGEDLLNCECRSTMLLLLLYLVIQYHPSSDQYRYDRRELFLGCVACHVLWQFPKDLRQVRVNFVRSLRFCHDVGCHA
jgi:hypothetical protein